MRISDWSSDVCSSDLGGALADNGDASPAAPRRLSGKLWPLFPFLGQGVRHRYRAWRLAAVPARAASVTGFSSRILLFADRWPKGLALLLGLVSATDFAPLRSEGHTSELQSLMRISYAAFA